MGNLLGSLLVLQLGLGLSQPELVVLDGSLGVSVGSIGTLQVALQIQNISLQLLLVQLNLGTGGSGGLTKTLTEVLQFTSEVRSLALSLGSALSLSLKFLLHLLNSGLNLLDGLLDLGNQGLFILQLAHQSRGILLLALDGISSSFLVLSSSETVSCMIFSSPSI